MQNYHTLQTVFLTEVGKVKKVNQDAVFCKHDIIDGHFIGVFAIADGVGGLSEGEVASSIAITSIEHWWDSILPEVIGKIEKVKYTLKKSFRSANHEILEKSSEKDVRMATTLSALLIYDDYYYVVHIGDSRIYIMNKNHERLTSDHSCVIDKIIDGVTFKKNVLTQCLGYKNDIDIQDVTGKIHKKDIFMVCSDGIYKRLTDDAIFKIIKRKRNNLEKCCRTLIEQAMSRGETDNISVILIAAKKQHSLKEKLLKWGKW